MLATGSFDASVGIWRHSDEDNNKIDVSRLRMDESEHTEEDEEDCDGWRFAIVLDGHESEVKSVSWSAGGDLLATCSRDKSIWIWEEVGDDDFETVAVMSEHEGDVKCVSWHPEEEVMASGSYDNDIRLWREDDDWGCVHILKGHESTVWCLEWEKPHGERLCSCSSDMTIRIWSKSPTSGWTEEARLPQIHERAIYAVAWKNGKIVSTGGDGRIVIYEERSTEPVNSDSDSYNREPMKIKGEERSLANGSGENSNIDATAPSAIATKEWIVTLQIENGHGLYEINHVCWASRGKDEDIIVTAGDDGVLKVWEPRPTKKSLS